MGTKHLDYESGSGSLRGRGNNDIRIDVDNDTNLTEESVYYQDMTKAGVTSGYGAAWDGIFKKDRAEIFINRNTTTPLGSGLYERGDAWMQSSANARVHASSDGDVTITLGN